MTDLNSKAIQHRTFLNASKWTQQNLSYRSPRGWDTKPPAVVSGKIHAIQIKASGWVSVDLYERKDQEFAQYATDWEKRVVLPLQKNWANPIVDNNLTIIGYIDSIRGDYLWVPWDYEDQSLFLGLAKTKRESIYDGTVPIRKSRIRPSEQWTRLATCDDTYKVMLDVNGTILSALSVESGNAVSVGLGPIEYISIGKIGIKIASSLTKRLFIKAGEKGLKTLAKQTVQRLSRLLNPAQQRLLRTQTNLLKKDVVRSIETLKSPTVYRHSITADVKWASYGQIKKNGQLSLSKGAKAHYGEGVYAWPAQKTNVGKYIDIEVAGNTGVEKIVTKNSGHWFRLVPAKGDKLSVKIVGHNFTKEEVKYAERLLNE